MITRSSQVLIQKYKDKLKRKYSLTDLGPANWLLGIKITRDLEAQTISLSHLSYIDSILTRFNFTNLKPFATPMDPSIRFSKDQCPQTPEEIAKMRNRLTRAACETSRKQGTENDSQPLGTHDSFLSLYTFLDLFTDLRLYLPLFPLSYISSSFHG